MHCFHKLILIAFTAAALLVTQSHAQRSNEQLQAGFDLLDRAAEIREAEPDLSRKLASDAAAMLSSATESSNQRSPLAQRSLGNAHLLAGDLGRAVLAFHRALDANPNDQMSKASLEYAQSQIDIVPSKSPADSWKNIIQTARANLPRKVLFYIGAACFISAFLFAAISIQIHWNLRLRAALKYIAVGLLIIATIPSTVLFADARWHAKGGASAVVLSSTQARSGPDESIYPEVFETPVPAGTSLSIRESRSGWLLVTLGSQEAWIDARDVERVRPIVHVGHHD
ncbi:MAG: hypothetical protein AB8F26_07415 [Phycisphaerales bacterium]